MGRPGVALREIHASGLRDPVRFSWESGNGHRMFLANIGEQEIESIYEVHPGDNSAGASERARLCSRRATPIRYPCSPPTTEVECLDGSARRGG
jgi:hypothetical protein